VDSGAFDDDFIFFHIFEILDLYLFLTAASLAAFLFFKLFYLKHVLFLKIIDIG